MSNVQRDVDKETLKGFFERFGEIETGPFGFDVNTGKSRGFAIFVYKTVEGARKALEEPVKVFQGHQLHCQKAAEGKNKNHSKAHFSQQVCKVNFEFCNVFYLLVFPILVVASFRFYGILDGVKSLIFFYML